MEKFLDPILRPTLKTIRVRYPLPVPVAKIPWREELLEAEKAVTKDINLTPGEAEELNVGEEPIEKQKVAKYRNSSVSSSLEDSQHSVKSARRELRLTHLGDSLTRPNEPENSFLSSRSMDETLDEVAWRKRNEKMRAGKYGNSSMVSWAVAEDSSRSVDSFGDQSKDSFGDSSESNLGDRSEASFENSLEDSVVAWQNRRENARTTSIKENHAENYKEDKSNQASKYRNISFFNQTSAGPEDSLQSCSKARRVLILTGCTEERQIEQRKTALVQFASDDKLVNRWISDMPNKVKSVSVFPSKLRGPTKLPVNEDGAVRTQEANGNTNRAPGRPSKMNGMAEVGGLHGIEAETNTLYDNVKMRDGRGCKMKDMAQATGNGKKGAEKIGKVKEPETKTGMAKDPVEKRSKVKELAKNMVKAKEPVEKIGKVKESAKIASQVKETANQEDKLKENAKITCKGKVTKDSTGKLEKTDAMSCKVKETVMMPAKGKETARQKAAKVKTVEDSLGGRSISCPTSKEEDRLQEQKKPGKKTGQVVFTGGTCHTRQEEEEAVLERKKPVKRLVTFGSKATKVSIGGTETMVCCTAL